MERRQPTEEELDAIMTDWLADSRDSDTAVHRGMEGAGRGNGGPGSGYYLSGDSILNESDPLKLLKKARSIAQTAVNATSNKPIRVRLGTEDSYTDGKTITVATDFFDEPYDTPYKIDVLTGYAIHEALHINHTGFEENLAWMKGMTQHKKEFCHAVLNIIEDERIEFLLSEPLQKGGDGKPGYTDFLATKKERSFARRKRPTDATTTPTIFLNLLILAVKYPKALDREKVRENYALLAAAKRILTPFPRTQQQAQQAAEKIYEAVKEHMAEEEAERRKQQQQKGQQGNGEISEEYKKGWMKAVNEYLTKNKNFNKTGQ